MAKRIKHSEQAICKEPPQVLLTFLKLFFLQHYSILLYFYFFFSPANIIGIYNIIPQPVASSTHPEVNAIKNFLVHCNKVLILILDKQEADKVELTITETFVNPGPTSVKHRYSLCHLDLKPSNTARPCFICHCEYALRYTQHISPILKG